MRRFVLQSALRARVGERKAHEIDEDLHRAQRLSAGNLAAYRRVGRHIADHQAVAIVQGQYERIAFAPLTGVFAQRAVGIGAGVDRSLPMRFTFGRKK